MTENMSDQGQQENPGGNSGNEGAEGKAPGPGLTPEQQAAVEAMVAAVKAGSGPPERHPDPARKNGEEQELDEAAASGETEDETAAPSEQTEVEEPQSETEIQLNRIYETLPEGERVKFQEAVNSLAKKESTPDDLVRSLKKAPFPPDAPNEFIRQVLKDSGQPDPIVDEVMKRRSEWQITEEELADEPEMEQKDKDTLVQAKEKANRVQSETKAAIAEAKAIESKAVITEEDLGRLRKLEKDTREKIKTWFEENPGKIHRVNRLLVRPGIAMMLLVMIMYLSALNVITSGAAKRVAK